MWRTCTFDAVLKKFQAFRSYIINKNDQRINTHTHTHTKETTRKKKGEVHGVDVLVFLFVLQAATVLYLRKLAIIIRTFFAV